MALIAHRFRGAVIAIVVLALSAGAVFAGQVPFQSPALAPIVAAQREQAEQADDQDGDAEQDGDDADDQDGDSARNHGALVSQAAQMDTPVVPEAEGEGWRNHGQFVSCVAHMKELPELADAQATADFLAALRPADCTAADEDDTDGEAEDEDGTESDAINHGTLVSEAARMETPEGVTAENTFRNHGEFVSCVARMKDVVLPTGMSTGQFLETVDAAGCREAAARAEKAAREHGKPDKADRAHGKGRGHKRS